jgi:hypothetical protein
MLEREYHKQFFQKLNLKAGEKASATDITHRPLSEKTPAHSHFEYLKKKTKLNSVA